MVYVQVVDVQRAYVHLPQHPYAQHPITTHALNQWYNKNAGTEKTGKPFWLMVRVLKYV